MQIFFIIFMSALMQEQEEEGMAEDDDLDYLFEANDALLLNQLRIEWYFSMC